jgi:hypothetical protein
MIFTRLALILSFCIPSMALAETEIRAGYSRLFANPAEVNDYVSPYPEVRALDTWTADAIFTLPSMPLGLGGRFEKFNQRESNATGETYAAWTRVSFLVNSRLIDEPSYYVGPIASIGVSNAFRLSLTPAASPASVDYKATGNLSGSLAVETGYKYDYFLVGAELGYMYAPLGDLKDSAGVSVSIPGQRGGLKTDLSALYLNLNIGVHF